MPAVNGVGEPCAGEPHARIEVAAGGIWCRVQHAETALAPPADPTWGVGGGRGGGGRVVWAASGDGWWLAGMALGCWAGRGDPVGGWWAWRPDPWWVDESSALLAAQQRSGNARSRANALASSMAHGQERCKRRIVRRAWRTIRAATCHSR